MGDRGISSAAIAGVGDSSLDSRAAGTLTKTANGNAGTDSIVATAALAEAVIRRQSVNSVAAAAKSITIVCGYAIDAIPVVSAVAAAIARGRTGDAMSASSIAVAVTIRSNVRDYGRISA